MESVRIAIDVDSGDYGPEVIVSGALDALDRNGRGPVEFYLCGDRATIEKELDKQRKKVKKHKDLLHIVHCTQSATSLETRRTRLWKDKADSSVIRCISLQKERSVDASVSAGDTGILMGAAIFILGRRKGVLRPALGAFLPTIRKKPVLLLDAGANINCRMEHLVSFAGMGREYVRSVRGVVSPAVALLNIGSESVKGTGPIGEAHAILTKKLRGYSGFIEGNEILSGKADVVVCDGFSGNVLLKAFESIHQLTASVLGREPDLLERIKKHMAVLDPELYGAVPFLGIKGMVFKAHGRSSPRAIASAIAAAEDVARRSEGKKLFR